MAQIDDIPMREFTIVKTLFLTQPSVTDGTRESARMLQAVCHGLAKEAGWWLDPTTGQDVRTWPKHLLTLWIGTKIALIHSEASEALEGLRKDRMDDHLPDTKQIEAELADVVIRVFDLAGGLGMDLGATIVKKLVFNATRDDHKMENRQAEGGKGF